MANKIKRLAIVGAASLLTLQAYAANPAQNNNSSNGVALTNNAQKLSYTIGYEMGQNFKTQAVTIDPKLLVKGLQDGLNGGGQPLLDKKARKATIVAFQKEVIAKQETAFKTLASKNAKVGTTFLAVNGKKAGVKTFADGLQYKIIKEGKGPKPTLKDSVTVNYAGSFIGGKVFDSSYKRGKPATFSLNQVIKGWQQALTKMPTGSTWEVYVPAKLAYGERGMGSLIGPNETLIFKIELISIDKKSA